ncbi:WD40-repeat-containing domain protein [Ephemerocybe angulata]|uniref:WD40-repeat-containing domain protein n=1 Tax=Ephemerocybe angulata TaxID=980116 RepID=A0A8H6IAT5_9AGAR|nr:WD40-repeat-containing domain protein [Tulosesus angulatus]
MPAPPINTIYIPTIPPPTPAPSPGPPSPPFFLDSAPASPPHTPASTASSLPSPTSPGGSVGAGLGFDLSRVDLASLPPEVLSLLASAPNNPASTLNAGVSNNYNNTNNTTTASTTTTPPIRRTLLTALLSTCSPAELLFISTLIAPRLKRDFLSTLPAELSLHILSFIEDPRTLGRAGRVCRRWGVLCREEGVWRGMCGRWGYGVPRGRGVGRDGVRGMLRGGKERRGMRVKERGKRGVGGMGGMGRGGGRSRWRRWRLTNWRQGGTLLRSHRIPPSISSPSHLPAPVPSLSSHPHPQPLNAPLHPPPLTHPQPQPQLQRAAPEGPVTVTSLALNADWVVLGLASSQVQVYSARTGVLAKTLVGHELGVWSPGSIVVSGGCDKVVMVWDVQTGHCIYRLSGHTSTIRCLRTVPHRPLAVSGSRDTILRVWNLLRGRCERVLRGHTGSVRCVSDVVGGRVVSGSYDATCRVWDIDTGECVRVLEGHFHQVYSVAFLGGVVASGGLDTTVRVWDVETGHCIALLQGHTALVCQLQLSPSLLITGGSDGRVITFSLKTLSVRHRIAAHDCSVTSLQFDRFIVTGGNDGRVRLYEVGSGRYVRDVGEGGETVWRVVVGWGVCVVVLRRAGRTVVEVWSMRG